MSDKSLFPDVSKWVAQVLVPQPIPELSYKIPLELLPRIKIGGRVIVPLGLRKMQTGVVMSLQETEQSKATKYIQDVLDDEAIIAPIQWEFMRWLASYYCCTTGEVLGAVLPGGLKLSSESFISVFEEFELWENLSDEENEVLTFISECQPVKLLKLEDEFPAYKLNKIIKVLIKHRAILFTEQVTEKYKPTFEKRYRLANLYLDGEQALDSLTALLRKTPKQLEFMERYFATLEDLYGVENLDYSHSFSRKEVLGLGSTSVVKSLIDKNILTVYDVEVNGFLPDAAFESYSTPKLSEAQEIALHGISKGFADGKPVLLHGITGSGKTEIYLQLIQQALASGTQVLFLLPEIALTTQIVSRVQQVFGENAILYHSKISEKERVETYQKVLAGSARLIVGVRSALLLPFQELGLVIVDEEHDSSYKQSDPAPRYNGRDSSLVLARFHHAKVLLGSATPSVESFYQASIGKWHLVSLKVRFSDAQLPDIQLIDLKFAQNAKRIEGNFTHDVLIAIDETVVEGNQVILFQNRRGFARYVSCQVCDYIPKCIRCDVSLTQHLLVQKLRCHYCGYEEIMPTFCGQCGSEEIQSVGFGTERLEEELHFLRPGLSISRMDLDTTRSKNKLATILKNVQDGHTDVLVGTQMVSKGFDFAGVKLVGVFDVDKMMHLPDYRAIERTFQLLTQVAGRAGRKGSAGTVMIQTVNVHQPLLKYVVENNYDGFYEKEILEREKFNYPPFTRLVLIICKCEDKELNFKAANDLALDIREKLGNIRVLGPESPPIGRINNLYHHHILLKLETAQINIKAVKDDLLRGRARITSNKDYRKVSVIINVDP